MKGSRLWDAHQTPAKNARAELPLLAGKFFVAGRQAAEETSPDALHEFRLSVKRFRYMLEAFRPLYGPGLEQRLESLRKIQQFLGAINDCATTRQLLADEGAGDTGETRQIFEFLDARARDAERKFKRYWREYFEAEGRRANWISYLTRYPGRIRVKRGGST